jgi:hypothetical protein
VRRRPVGSDLPVWPTGKLILVGTPGGTVAYALPDLAERWRSRADLAGRWVQDGCAEICSLSWQGGLRVLDRETGQERWSDERWNYADQVGRWLLTTDNRRPERLPGVSVVDPGTGRVHGDFGSWHPIGADLPDGTVHGIREVPGADIVWYARLDPATLAVRVLGRADRVSGDCQATADVLVCRRIDATVGVWRLK